MAASFLPFAQQILGGLLRAPDNSSSDTGSSGSSIGDSSSTPFPSDFVGWATFLFSFAALRDWAKLFVLGTVLETLRRYAFWFYNRTTRSMFATAHFTQNDSSYTWIMIWLAKQPSWSNSRDVEISTISYGGNSAAIELDGDEDMEGVRGSRKITYLPSLSSTYHVWYKRHLITITRTQSQPAGLYDRPENNLTLSIFDPFRSTVLRDLLQEAREGYVVAQTRSMRIWVSDSGNNWRYVASREKRDLSSIILDPGVKDLIVDDAKDFLDSEDWYRSRGIPFRRGYLLHGTPGSGKTSLIHGIAGELGLDVFVITLSRVGLDDSGLQELVNNLPPQCIAVMEDIDAAFTHGLTRDASPSSGDDVDDRSGGSPGVGGGVAPAPTQSRLSLSGLLNSLDGIGSQEGRILFATTNKYTALDPALCRPGRMDLHIEFQNASKYQASLLFERFYMPTEIEDKKPVTSSEEDDSDSTSIDEKKDSPALVDANSSKEETGSDSGYSSTPGSATPSDEGIKGYRHKTRGPILPKAQITALAETFVAHIPERGCSMASLQGYLMMHKSRPILAAEQVEAWVEKEKVQSQLQKGLPAASVSPSVPPSTGEEKKEPSKNCEKNEQHEKVSSEPNMVNDRTDGETEKS